VRPRILVVDDQPDAVRLVTAMLEPYGFDIRAASSGEEALALLTTDHPDLILLDVVMQGISGYDVCRAIRENEATSYLPVVMLTADRDQDKVAGLDAGADDFIVKPFERHELLARVRSLLRIKTYHDKIAELNRTLEGRVSAQVAEILALRGLGGSARFHHEGEFWSISFDGSSFRLRDTKGLHYIADLLREPGRERHALDLVTAHGGGDEGARPVASDTGPLLDPAAKSQYRVRLDELAAELNEAEQHNDPERAARAREEREVLVEHLASAVGLGGRDRRAASDTERARVSVTRAIRAALERIAEHSPALDQHFASTMRTGQFCVYVPDPRSPLRWEL
jgi:CheY-like chemotaxis protein